MPFAVTWMDLGFIITSGASQTEKDNYMMSLICGILKMVEMNILRKQKQTHRHRKQT